MKHMFSDSLIKRLQEYLRKKRGVEVDDETANMYLSSMADLFLIFAGCVKRVRK